MAFGGNTFSSVASTLTTSKQENKGKGKKGKKGKQRSLTQEDKESEAEPEGEVVMSLRAGEHRISAMAERTGARIAGVCSVKGQVETCF